MGIADLPHRRPTRWKGFLLRSFEPGTARSWITI